ncbi:LysR substrate-binding domain-containing protein [Pelagibius sp.]|uniref:LysR substrate-binding domain-containing protein n=1 Tax=Pelagibius sp. TaxID=1931238 RepID=UPI002606A925|nr:LysR substrate-binding domain-containing protein [Pelagibius sp.]
MNRNLDIGLLRAFAAVAGTRSMTTAADRLGLTQGAVSQQVKRLEEMLDCVLFDRARRGLKLTARGDQMLGHAKRLLAMNDEILQEMTGPAIDGKVRLGIPFDLVSTYLPLVFEGFAEANPRIEVSLNCATSKALLASLRDGSVDVALVEEPLGESKGECLSVERLLWIGSKNGTAHRKRPLPLSIVSETCAFRDPIVEALEARAIPWRPVFEYGTLEATMTTVRSDLAVTAFLGSFIPGDMEVLRRDSGLPELPNFTINLYESNIETNPAARQVADYLRESMIGQNRRSA